MSMNQASAEAAKINQLIETLFDAEDHDRLNQLYRETVAYTSEVRTQVHLNSDGTNKLVISSHFNDSTLLPEWTAVISTLLKNRLIHKTKMSASMVGYIAILEYVS